METLQLGAVTRAEADQPKKIRQAGDMPAILYGNKSVPVNLKVKQNEFQKIFRKAGTSTLVELSVDGKINTVLIHDVQMHYLTSQPIHADFLVVNMKEKLTAKVPLEFIGEAMAAKAMGGTLAKMITEIEVECLPHDLPHVIEVDISPLNTFEDSILAGNINLPKGVSLVTSAEETVAKVDAPRNVEAELAKEIGDVSQVAGIKKEEPAPAADAKK